MHIPNFVVIKIQFCHSSACTVYSLIAICYLQEKKKKKMEIFNNDQMSFCCKQCIPVHIGKNNSFYIFLFCSLIAVKRIKFSTGPFFHFTLGTSEMCFSIHVGTDITHNVAKMSIPFIPLK